MEAIIREVQNAQMEMLAGRLEEAFIMLQNVESELISIELKKEPVVEVNQATDSIN